MKRVLISLMLGVGILLGSGGLATAAFDPFGDVCDDAPNSTVCQDAQKTQTASNNSLYGPDGVITKAIGLISTIIGIAAVIVLMVAGFKYITAGGDANSVASAKNTAIYAVVGVLIALFARALVTFVFNKL